MGGSVSDVVVVGSGAAGMTAALRSALGVVDGGTDTTKGMDGHERWERVV